ncbi:MAG: ATP-dependent DNA helicase RecG [Microbacteriaceae bacterium BACL25 MAG-120322-bin65]|jgi:ATP-dependent DNA helicase RecG|nr:MAG: ATP-dependent DNA helicase RecG [Microbacteriaceae bacterium BACL25 MAG-120322-bin65]HAA79952.1 ATP-dependent DNA helicase RecG [Microbacteriaceae bacterium]
MDTKLRDVLGDRTQKALHKAFGYVTVGDLLGHFPRRYATRGELTSMADIPIGEQATLVAEVVSVSQRPMRQKSGSVLEVAITDGTGLVTLTFFNQAWRQKDLVPGTRGIFAGKVGLYRGTRQLAHPDYELFESSELSAEASKEWALRPIPLYPATQSVASWQIGKAIGVALDVLDPVEDPIPPELATSQSLMDFASALEKIHRPKEAKDAEDARESLKFQEAFVLQCALVRRRHAQRSVATMVRASGDLTQEFVSGLPFVLTPDQEQVVADIHADLASGHPMNRLVQGEVGSGKTVVAAAAMVTVAQSGGQTALLAPTEVLASQHYRSLMATLGPDMATRLNPVLLTAAMPAAKKKKALLAAASGASHLVVGTHALLSDSVAFADLGLVVIDEQHRFGVNQREALRQKGTHPHVLVLTATPIPRTVAMTVFGDLDVSTIRTMPSGRSPIETHVVALDDHPSWYSRVWTRLSEEVVAGRQGFVVAPAIAPSVIEENDLVPVELTSEETIGEKPRALVTVEETLPMVRALPEFASHRVEAIHGRLSGDEKDQIMNAFHAGEIDVLIATTVIEVGIDVANASMMVVLDADRFGVSQLHQLRGRVGRGAHPGTCLLVTYAPAMSVARQRVDAVAATLDGFDLAAIDLELRREGDVLGARQSGVRSGLKLLRVSQDGELIEKARTYAQELLDQDPELVEHAALGRAIARRLDDSAEEFLEKN